MDSKVIERFWSKVDKSSGPNGCWERQGWCNEKGYAYFDIAGKPVRAHRFAYEITFGPIPEGLVVDHVKARGCTSRRCVNPAHLEAITTLENNRRAGPRGARGTSGLRSHCMRGHELTPKNRETNRRGQSQCRTCHNERSNERRRSLRRNRAH